MHALALWHPWGTRKTTKSTEISRTRRRRAPSVLTLWHYVFGTHTIYHDIGREYMHLLVYVSFHLKLLFPTAIALSL